MNNNRIVLSVNRSPELAEYFLNFIPLLGDFKLEGAANLIEALAKTNAYRPELIIYNLTIQQAHARDLLLAELRRKHTTTQILVLAENKAEAEKIKLTGIQNILIHPFDLTELSHFVSKILVPKNETIRKEEFAKLLIADDEPYIYQFLSETFEHLGLEVFTASNGQEAVEVYNQNHCNLVITDLKMPSMRGDQVAKVLEQCETPPKDLIIMTAGLGDSLPELRRKNIAIFEKPLDIKSLEEKILSDCRKYNLTLKRFD